MSLSYRAKSNIVGWCFLAPYGLAFLVFVFLPVAISLVLSFVLLDIAKGGRSHFVGVQNFADAFKDQYFWKSVIVTLQYAALMVPASLIIGLLLALGLFAMSDSGRDRARAFIYAPGMLNVAAAGILWQWFFNPEFGLINYLAKRIGLQPLPWLSDKHYAMPAVVIMSLWWTIGSTTILILTGLQQIPVNVFEAASLDGADGHRTLTRITLPSLRPVLDFVFVTTAIAAFQMFGQATILTAGGPEFSTRGMVQYMFENAFNDYRFGYGAAVSWLLALMIGSFALLQGRFLRRVVRD